MAKFLLLNGPNLDLLGTREPEVYGGTGLPAIELALGERVRADGHQLDTLQSNAEHVLIDRIHETAHDGTDFILFNPGAFTHTSVALRDALLGVAVPFIELHLSNIHAREPFRRHSYLADVAVGVIAGFGAYGYQLAYLAALEALERRASQNSR